MSVNFSGELRGYKVNMTGYGIGSSLDSTVFLDEKEGSVTPFYHIEARLKDGVITSIRFKSSPEAECDHVITIRDGGSVEGGMDKPHCSSGYNYDKATSEITELVSEAVDLMWESKRAPQ